jgi:predicted anti-sigma-YlaC factor YlaD
LTNCTDIRWKLSRFLEGELPPGDSERVRDHLDACPACVTYLVNSGKIERMSVEESRGFSPDFNTRLLTETAIHDSGSTLTRLLYYIFGAASLLAISVFAFVRYYVTPHDLTALGYDLWGGETLATLFPWLKDWLTSPIFSYTCLSLGAVLLSVMLIFAVDTVQQVLPRREK